MHPPRAAGVVPGHGAAGSRCREPLTSVGPSYTPRSLLCARRSAARTLPRVPRSAGLRRPPAGPHSARRPSGQLTAGRRLARSHVRKLAGSGRGGADHRGPLPTAWTDRSCDQAHCLPTAADARHARRRLPPARLPGPHLIGAHALTPACTDPAHQAAQRHVNACGSTRTRRALTRSTPMRSRCLRRRVSGRGRRSTTARMTSSRRRGPHAWLTSSLNNF